MKWGRKDGHFSTLCLGKSATWTLIIQQASPSQRQIEADRASEQSAPFNTSCFPAISWWRPFTSMFHCSDSHYMLKWCVPADACTHTNTYLHTNSLYQVQLSRVPLPEKSLMDQCLTALYPTLRHISLSITSWNGLFADDQGGKIPLMKTWLSKMTFICVFISLTECCNVCSQSSPPPSLLMHCGRLWLVK